LTIHCERDKIQAGNYIRLFLYLFSEVIQLANDENLVPLTTEKAREVGRLGGIASGEAKRRRKTLREELLALLSDEGVQERMSLALIREATEGNSSGSVARAFETVRDTVGEKPTESMVLTASVNTPYDELTAEQLRELLKMHENGAI